MTDVPATPEDGTAIRGESAIEVDGRVRGGIVPAVAEGAAIMLSWVPEDRIPRGHRAYVRKHVDRAAAQLGLGRITVRWFGPAIAGGDFYGVAPFADAMPLGVMTDGSGTAKDMPMTIALNAGMRGPIVVAVVAHEVRHVAQHVMRTMLDGREAREADADDFAGQYVSELVDR